MSQLNYNYIKAVPVPTVLTVQDLKSLVGAFKAIAAKAEKDGCNTSDFQHSKQAVIWAAANDSADSITALINAMQS